MDIIIIIIIINNGAFAYAFKCYYSNIWKHYQGGAVYKAFRTKFEFVSPLPCQKHIKSSRFSNHTPSKSEIFRGNYM